MQISDVALTFDKKEACSQSLCLSKGILLVCECSRDTLLHAVAVLLCCLSRRGNGGGYSDNDVLQAMDTTDLDTAYLPPTQ